MNEPELIRAATTSGGKFYTPATTATLLEDLPKPAEGAARHRSADPALEHLAGPGAVPGRDHGGMGFEETQADGMIVAADFDCPDSASTAPQIGRPGRFGLDDRGRGQGQAGGVDERAVTWNRGSSSPARQVRRLLALHGLSWVVAAAGAAGDRGRPGRLADPPRRPSSAWSLLAGPDRPRAAGSPIATCSRPWSSGSATSTSRCGSSSAGRA